MTEIWNYFALSDSSVEIWLILFLWKAILLVIYQIMSWKLTFPAVFHFQFFREFFRFQIHGKHFHNLFHIFVKTCEDMSWKIHLQPMIQLSQYFTDDNPHVFSPHSFELNISQLATLNNSTQGQASLLFIFTKFTF